jgi:hypothetical protein
MNINTVKYKALIEEPYTYLGYIVNSKVVVPLDDGNGAYQDVVRWINEGNSPSNAFTQAEIDEYEAKEIKKKQESLMKGGQLVGLENDSRISVGSPEVITGIEEYNQWMFDLYYNYDNGKLFIPAPPLEIIDNLKMFGVDINEYN